MSAEIDEYPSLRFQDIRKKKQSVMDGRTHGRTDNMKTLYPTTNKVCRGCGGITIQVGELKQKISEGKHLAI